MSTTYPSAADHLSRRNRAETPDPDEDQSAKHRQQLAALAKPGCNKCHGRGYISRHVGTGLYVACKCVMKNHSAQERAKKEAQREYEATLAAVEEQEMEAALQKLIDGLVAIGHTSACATAIVCDEKDCECGCDFPAGGTL